MVKINSRSYALLQQKRMIEEHLQAYSDLWIESRATPALQHNGPS